MSCTLVLLPGMDGTGELFFPLTDALGADIPTKIVRYPDLALDYREHEEFVRERLPRDGAFVVLGESFSSRGSQSSPQAGRRPCPRPFGVLLGASQFAAIRCFETELRRIARFVPVRSAARYRNAPPPGRKRIRWNWSERVSSISSSVDFKFNVFMIFIFCFTSSLL